MGGKISKSSLIQELAQRPEILLPDRPIAFNRNFVNLGIGINGALLLSQAIYWSKRTKDNDGWFYKTVEEWESETGLTMNEQRAVKNKLTELGFLQIQKRSMPAKNHFRVDKQAVALALVELDFVENKDPQYCEIHSTRDGNSTAQDLGNSQHTLLQRVPESTNKAPAKNSPTRRLQSLSESLPNTAVGEIPKINHRPPLDVKEEKRIQRKLSGFYDNTFGSKAIRIVKHFCALYMTKYERPYGSIVKVDTVAKNLSRYFKEGETEESLKKMLDDYFASDKATALPVKLTTAFSEDTYLAWTQGKLGDGSGASVYPMNVDGLTIRNDEELAKYYREGIVVETSRGSGKWILTNIGKEVRDNG